MAKRVIIFLDICLKILVFRRVFVCMTTGFGPFELSACGLLQKGQDHRNCKTNLPCIGFCLTVVLTHGGTGGETCMDVLVQCSC